MKICPTCRKTYTDDGLNFCLEDGSVLTLAQGEPAPTVMMPQPPPTNPGPGIAVPPTNPGGFSQQQVQSSWDRQSQYSVQPKKKSSKTWLWVVGLLGIGLLLCGGGIVGLVALAIYNAEPSGGNSASNSSRFPSNISNSRVNSAPPSDSRTKLESIDFSRWVQEDSTYGNTDFTGGELVMSAKKKGFYYVLVAQKNYTTEEANTRLTVRNLDDADSSMGYGLVFHSNPTPLQQGYAFLIDAKKKRYRVVRHIPQDEPVIIKWTNSNAIKDGDQENVLEVRDKNGNIELYINDERITSISNTYGYKGGVPGVYSGDGVRAAFSKLEIRK
jgi:hypothetical protein